MGVSPARITLYAANPADFRIALAASAPAGIPAGHVCGEFYEAWRRAASGDCLLIAVGANALNALYYNPCGWPNPQERAAGSTPFQIAGAPQSTLPGPCHCVNGAGALAADTLKRTAMLAYFAVHEAYPAGYGDAPPAGLEPKNNCAPGMASHVLCPC